MPISRPSPTCRTLRGKSKSIVHVDSRMRNARRTCRIRRGSERKQFIGGDSPQRFLFGHDGHLLGQTWSSAYYRIDIPEECRQAPGRHQTPAVPGWNFQQWDMNAEMGLTSTPGHSLRFRDRTIRFDRHTDSPKSRYTHGPEGAQEDGQALEPTKAEIEQDLNQLHVPDSEIEIDLCDSASFLRKRPRFFR